MDRQNFNMTPIIDIVFLLIIFFVVISRFIEADNSRLNVPDECNYAQTEILDQQQPAVLSVVKKSDSEVNFFLDSKEFESSSYQDITAALATGINDVLENKNDKEAIIVLSIDEDICFEQAQTALAAISQSNAKNIKLSVLKEKRPQ